MKRNKLLASLGLLLGAFAASSVLAQAPAGSTGECKDGTYTTAKNERGACSRHGGVKTWFEQGTKKPAKSSSKAAAGKATEGVPAEAPTAAPATTPSTPAPAASAKASAKSSATRSAPAAGGGEGQVWVNTDSKVYHCSGDRWYGKTKKGEYMSEAQAKANGYRADHNKPCK